MTTPIRLLWSSNAPWANSGYGIQSRHLLWRLAQLPEIGGKQNIGIFAWFGLQGGIHVVDGHTCYPAGNDPYGNDVIGKHTQHFGANVVSTLIDVWVCHDHARKVAPALWCPYLPIDHDPVPQRVLDSLAGAHLPITYAKWGHEMLTKAGVENHYIPHGVEPNIYHVIQDVDKVREFKRLLTGRDDIHLTTMVSANKGSPDRKAFQVQLPAWAAFAKDKPHCYLYVHTEPTPMYGGVDFAALTLDLGIADRVIYPDRYENFIGLPQEYLKWAYNASDMFMGASMSEGFGIPLVEAQSCGVPVVTTNFSAMPELVRWGKAVDPISRFWTPMNAWQAWPDAKGITEVLEEYHQLWLDNGRQLPMDKRLEAQNAIHAEYNWDTIVRDQWAPLMTRLANEAPPLDNRFQIAMPQTHKDEVSEFVAAVNEGVKPKRRVAPLTTRATVEIVNTAVSGPIPDDKYSEVAE